MRRVLKRWRWQAASAIALVGTSSVVAWAVVVPPHAGPQQDGSALTTYGWRVTPAGGQRTLGEKPFGTVLSPDGKYLAVSNDGTYTQSLSLVSTATGKTVQQINYNGTQALFVGLAWSTDGSTLYAS